MPLLFRSFYTLDNSLSPKILLLFRYSSCLLDQEYATHGPGTEVLWPPEKSRFEIVWCGGQKPKNILRENSLPFTFSYDHASSLPPCIDFIQTCFSTRKG